MTITTKRPECKPMTDLLNAEVAKFVAIYCDGYERPASIRLKSILDLYRLIVVAELEVQS